VVLVAAIPVVAMTLEVAEVTEAETVEADEAVIAKS
jgi:hypothetical protein